MNSLSRFWRLLLSALAIVAALLLSFFTTGRSGIHADLDNSRQAEAARAEDPSDIFHRALREVTQRYAEPERIDYRRMFLSGLNAIQRSVAPVMVDYHEGDDRLQLRAHDAEQSFAVNLESPWQLTSQLEEVFVFLEESLAEDDVELDNVRYTAVNGMLRTLDPHTILLTPDVFEEMRVHTQGVFEGVGLSISIVEGNLTVIKPLPGTPAEEAGMRPYDRIVTIAQESTLNMPLTEAVDRLRGEEGSIVNVEVLRRNNDGEYPGPRIRVPLRRARIQLDTVESRRLEGNIGYVKIHSFRERTAEQLREALSALETDGQLRGLVLDLRDNPGGLLDQAVAVSDMFLESGPIVTTSSSDPREDERSFAQNDTGDRDEPTYPMVVLVNGSSASASEIVAGALKNHDRAMVIGQRSFGKGSVQVLSGFPDGSALKLTVAQYLTPGDISIQGVGILPDIGIDPMTVDREDMDLVIDPNSYLREADLRSALTNDRAEAAERPDSVIRYYLSREDRQRLRELAPEDDANEEEDEFLLRFAGELLRNVTSANRPEMIRQAGQVIDQVNMEELSLAHAELERLGVDWSEGPSEGPTSLEVEVDTTAENNVATAGEPLSLRVRVTNVGTTTAYRLRAVTESDNALFDERELVFGRIAPGETREWTTNLGVCETENNERVCRIPRNISDRADAIKVNFLELHDNTPPGAEVRTTIRALPRPLFAYATHFADDVEGNGDGRLQAGERGSLYLRVRNNGEGQSFETHANLRNMSGRGVMLRAGRFRIDNIAPGEERLVHFTFDVFEDFEGEEVSFEVSIIDADLRESIVETVRMPITASDTLASDVAPARGRVTLAESATLRSCPDATCDVVGRVEGGGLTTTRSATSGDFVRVALDGDQPAWVLAGELTRSGSGGSIVSELSHEPPQVNMTGTPVLVTRDDSIRLQGQARDNNELVDLYIFVGARKVHYASNSDGDGTIDYDVEIPLQGGINYVTVFARESEEVVGRRTLVIRRDGPNGELLETPRYDEEVWGNPGE